jgi:hypothetical protein
MSKPRKRDVLNQDELATLDDMKFYVPGRAYLWVMGFGWAIVGYYVKHENPLVIRAAHASHFRNAGKDYGLLIQEGGSSQTEWRYEGNELLHFHAIQRVTEYYGEVHRGNIRTR